MEGGRSGKGVRDLPVTWKKNSLDFIKPGGKKKNKQPQTTIFLVIDGIFAKKPLGFSGTGKSWDFCEVPQSSPNVAEVRQRVPKTSERLRRLTKVLSERFRTSPNEVDGD